MKNPESAQKLSANPRSAVFLNPRIHSMYSKNSAFQSLFKAKSIELQIYSPPPSCLNNMIFCFILIFLGSVFPGMRLLLFMIIYFQDYNYKLFSDPDEQVLQTYMSSLVSPGQCSKPHLIEACKSLAILYDTCCQLNKRRKEEFIPLSEFYNEDLSLKMDFKKEYENWRALNETKRYTKSAM